MKKPEYIIVLEENDISMFVIQGILAPFEQTYIISYFTNEDETMDYLSKFPDSPEISITLFVNIGIVLNNHDFVKSARKILITTSSRLFLLAAMPLVEEKMKEFHEQGFICCIEKPLTEQKFIQAVNFESPADSFLAT